MSGAQPASVWADLPGVRVTLLGRPGQGVAMDSIVGSLFGAPEPEPSPAMLERWDALRRANPRLFNGPVLGVRGAEVTPGGVRLTLGLGSYLTLCTQEPDGPRLVQGSVTGLVRGADGRVLLGRRGASTRLYPGLWELAPSGGIDPPASGPGPAWALGGADVLAQLRRELREEVGGGLQIEGARALALVEDDAGPSCDVVVGASVRGEPGGGSWEYAEWRWVAPGGLGAFGAVHRLSPPTRALLRALGMMGGA